MSKRTITTEYERKDGEIVKKITTEEEEPYVCENAVCDAETVGGTEPEAIHYIEYEEELSVLDVIAGLAGLTLIVTSVCMLYKMFRK